MIAYKNIDVDELSFEIIEKFMKKTKTHRNMADAVKWYIEKIWRETYNLIVCQDNTT